MKLRRRRIVTLEVDRGEGLPLLVFSFSLDFAKAIWVKCQRGSPDGPLRSYSFRFHLLPWSDAPSVDETGFLTQVSGCNIRRTRSKCATHDLEPMTIYRAFQYPHTAVERRPDEMCHNG